MVMMDGRQASIWTAMPGIVESFDASEMTATIQVAIQAQAQAPDGSFSWVNLPVLIHCPVQFPAGGGFTLTFPVVAGDECLVVFASRCIDSWWQSGGVQPQAEFRMHDLSDGFAFLGFRSQPRKISGISSDATQLRSDDGSCYVELGAGHQVNIVAPGGINLTGPVTANGHRIDETHVHSGVTTGGGDTGPVT